MLICDYHIPAKTPKSSILGGTILPWTTTPSVTVALACVSISALISALNSGFPDPSSAGHWLVNVENFEILVDIDRYQCLCHVLIERIEFVESVFDCVAYVTSGIANISRGVVDGAANLAEEATLELKKRLWHLEDEATGGREIPKLTGYGSPLSRDD